MFSGYQMACSGTIFVMITSESQDLSGASIAVLHMLGLQLMQHMSLCTHESFQLVEKDY
jgi:hypothetical protein